MIRYLQESPAHLTITGGITEAQGLHGSDDEQLLLDQSIRDERELESQPAA
jgi:hypothetical protein